MSAATFDLSLSLPADRKFVGMLRDLAVHGAKHAGLSEADAHAFGHQVEQAAREALATVSSTAIIPVTVHCAEGPVEMTIGSCCVSTTR